MLKNLAHQIQVFVEYRIKHFGLFGGLFIVLFVFPILLWLDYKFSGNLQWFHRDHYDKLLSINNSLSGFLISILLTTFSVVFVVMQLASSQFSPRVLRYFLANDVDIQQFIGLYLGAIGLIFLIQIAGAFDGTTAFNFCLIASLSINLYSILVSFPGIVVHLNDNMNVATITNSVKNEVMREVDVLYAEAWQKGAPLLYKCPHIQLLEHHIEVFWQQESGYLAAVDYDQLSASFGAFVRKNADLPPCTIYQKPIVGEFILCNATVVFVLDFGKALPPDVRKKVEATFAGIAKQVFDVNKFRSYKQDVNFGVRKLVDISIKAISPAVNDPTTCLNCVDYLGEIVGRLATKQYPSTQSRSLRHDQIFINEFEFDDLVNFAFDQIYQWGKKDHVVMKRIIKAIALMLPRVQNPYNLMVLIRQVEEMELHKIYTPGLDNVDHSTEQISTVTKELQYFKVLAIRQIERLQQFGILDGYAQKNNEVQGSGIRAQEIQCVQYLRQYLEDNK